MRIPIIVDYSDLTVLLKVERQWSIIFATWSNGKRNVAQRVLLVSVAVLSILNGISNTVNLLRCRGELNCMMDTVTHLSVIIGSNYYFGIYLFKESVFQSTYENLYKLRDKYNTHEYTAKMERTTREVITVWFIYCITGCGWYIVIPVISYNYCLQHTNPFDKMNMYTCGLAMPAWFPFDVTTSPGYEAALIFQTFGATYAIFIFETPQTIAWSLILHLIVHIRNLKHTLKNILSEPEEKRLKILKHCIQYHNDIIDHIGPILDACNKLFSFNIVFVVLIMTATGFNWIKFVFARDYWNIFKYSIMVSAWVTILLVNSLIGQKLKEESWGIMDSAYNMEWYMEPVTFQKMILLLMLRANHPLILRNASLSENSLENFSVVMSSTYRYITLLLNYLD